MAESLRRLIAIEACLVASVPEAGSDAASEGQQRICTPELGKSGLSLFQDVAERWSGLLATKAQLVAALARSPCEQP